MSVLAIDIGSSRIKALLARWDGHVLEVRGTATPRQSLEPGEQSYPLEAVRAAVEGLIAGLGAAVPHDQVDTLVFSCLGTAMAPLDRDGRTLGPALAPADLRPQGSPWLVDELGLDASELARRSGSDPAVASFLLHALWWQREHPSVMERAHRFRSPRGYVLAGLCEADAEDRAWASRTMLADLETGTWSPQVLAAAGLAAELLPPVEPPTATFPLLPDAVERLGLAPGAVAVLGAMDNGCSLLGAAGPDRSGLANIVGTYEHMAGAGDLDGARRVAESTGAVVHAHVLSGSFIAMSRVPIGDLLGRAATGSKAGLDGLLELVPAEPAAEPIPLTPEGVEAALGSGRSRSEVLAALLASAGAVLARFAEAWGDLGRPTEPVAVVGGGARHENVLRLKATLLGRRLALLASDEAAALGALRLAAMAVRGASPAEACRLFDNPIARIIEPSTAAAEGVSAA